MNVPVTVIIPTLNAGRYVEKLVTAILGQAYRGPLDILIVDSSSEDNTLDLARRFSQVRWIQIPRASFTHGYARNLGVREAKGEFVVFLSQDALPFNEEWLKSLLRPLVEEGMAASFSRQIPYSNATPMEAYFLKVHFPEGRRVMKANASCQPLKLPDVFFSNVSSAARRAALLETPFQEDLIMSEDQQFSRDVIAKGHAVSYEPSSIVWHSHRYNLKTIFQRYFDSAYSLSCIFQQDLGESFHIRRDYYWGEFLEMLLRHPLWLPYYFFYLVAQGAGAMAGHFAPRLPVRIARGLSMHKGYWERIAKGSSLPKV